MYKVRNKADKKYIVDVAEEAKKLGLDPIFSPGCNYLGLGTVPEKKFEHVKSLADLKDGQGREFIRERVNANTKPLLDNLFTISVSVNNQVARLGPEALKAFHEKAVTHAIKQVNTYLDSHLGARVGADGLERIHAKVVSVAMTGAVARAGDMNLHVHYYLLDKGMVEGKQLRTLDTRPLFDATIQKRIDSIFQHAIASQCEKELGWTMDIDKRGHAVVRGIPNEKESVRHKVAEEYLKKRNLPRDDIHFEAAMKATRPPKESMAKLDAEQKFKQWQADYIRVHGTQHKHEEHHVRDASRHESTLRKWMAIPAKIVEAYKVSKNRNSEKVVVLDASQFIKDFRKPTLLECHNNGIRTLRRSKANSFNHALEIASKGFWSTKPKRTLPKNTRIAIHTDAIRSRKELQQLKEIATLNHFRLHIRGDMSKFQDRRDRDQDRDMGR